MALGTGYVWQFNYTTYLRSGGGGWYLLMTICVTESTMTHSGRRAAMVLVHFPSTISSNCMVDSSERLLSFDWTALNIHGNKGVYFKRICF